MSRSISFVLTVLLTGCASYWTHSDKNRLSYFQQDVADCQVYANNATYGQRSPPVGNMAGAMSSAMLMSMNRDSYVEQCLRAKGYYQTSE
ncbi:hypothetical protein [Polynucleobacter tropicus]|uniref:hypothetical protein n=1 Tax=Polynucleobacter tropicus TaxID=1743174 RepID=UPI00157060A7|nr:hypothetical protein [Polynucleobacter tropicus]